MTSYGLYLVFKISTHKREIHDPSNCVFLTPGRNLNIAYEHSLNFPHSVIKRVGGPISFIETDRENCQKNWKSIVLFELFRPFSISY